MMNMVIKYERIEEKEVIVNELKKRKTGEEQKWTGNGSLKIGYIKIEAENKQR